LWGSKVFCSNVYAGVFRRNDEREREEGGREEWICLTFVARKKETASARNLRSEWGVQIDISHEYSNVQLVLVNITCVIRQNF